MKPSNVIRVVAVALVLSTLSFAAGVAGDLSLATPPNYGERVVLRLPPELPTDAIRAGPLANLSTAPRVQREAALVFDQAEPLPLLKVRNEVILASFETKPIFDDAPKPV